MQRRLTAILAADVAGYSRHMEVAEEPTAKGLAECQSMIARTADRFGGRIFNTAGNSALAEFSSPVNAVHCGVEIQRANDAAVASEDDPAQLALRIGVHLADVIVSGARSDRRRRQRRGTHSGGRRARLGFRQPDNIRARPAKLALCFRRSWVAYAEEHFGAAAPLQGRRQHAHEPISDRVMLFRIRAPGKSAREPLPSYRSR